MFGPDRLAKCCDEQDNEETGRDDQPHHEPPRYSQHRVTVEYAIKIQANEGSGERVGGSSASACVFNGTASVEVYSNKDGGH